MSIKRFNSSFCFSKYFSRERSSPPPPNFAPPFCALCLIVCDFLPKTWNLGRKAPPQSLRDSSPKGAPFSAATKLPATTKAVPLGKVAATSGSRRKGFSAEQRARPLRHGLRRATSPKGRGSGETAHFAVQPETIPPCQGLSLWESCHQR